MKELLPFASVLAHLQKHDVLFIVCGGLAVAFCGFVRATEDIDILVKTDPANVKKLLGCLAGFGEGLGGTLSESDFSLEPGCLEINEPACRIDIFTLMDGKTFEEQLPLSQLIKLADLDLEVRHLSRSQLIAAKMWTMRDKDRIDVDALRRLECGEEI